MTFAKVLDLVLAELDHAEDKYPAFTRPEQAVPVLLKQLADLTQHLQTTGDPTHDLPQIAVAAIRGLMAVNVGQPVLVSKPAAYGDA